MHSIVAERLENLQVLEFWKQTVAEGITRPSNIASWGGKTVIVDDDVPVNGDEYTTYMLGAGVLRTANGRLKVPAETHRDEWKSGGENYLTTRIRKTMHPNGFSFIIPETNWEASPTDAQLFDSDNYKIIFDPKAIAISKLVTTETTV